MALSQKQLSERKNFIGSSEAKIIANGSFEDWAKLISEKKGEQQRLVSKQLQFLFDTGNYMEAFVLDQFENVSNLKANQRNSGRTVDHMGTPVHSTYDAIVLTVSHDQFYNLNLSKLKNRNSVVYDVKGVLGEASDKKL